MTPKDPVRGIPQSLQGSEHGPAAAQELLLMYYPGSATSLVVLSCIVSNQVLRCL